MCKRCTAAIAPAKGTFRNHCPRCLTSLHVDIVPGDRAADCYGLMHAVHLEGASAQGFSLLHRCTQCGIERRNRTAPDDDFNALLQLTQQSAA